MNSQPTIKQKEKGEIMNKIKKLYALAIPFLFVAGNVFAEINTEKAQGFFDDAGLWVAFVIGGMTTLLVAKMSWGAIYGVFNSVMGLLKRRG